MTLLPETTREDIVMVAETTVLARQGFTAITQCFAVAKIDEFVVFLEKAFGAKLVYSLRNPQGGIAYCQVQIGDSRIMASPPMMESQETKCSTYLYVDNCDAVYAQALAAGATSGNPPMDMFYGDRCAGVRDPFGNTWAIATHVEDVSEEEVARRAAAMNFGGAKDKSCKN
jgi:PhnB protein